MNWDPRWFPEAVHNRLEHKTPKAHSGWSHWHETREQQKVVPQRVPGNLQGSQEVKRAPRSLEIIQDIPQVGNTFNSLFPTVKAPVLWDGKASSLPENTHAITGLLVTRTQRQLNAVQLQVFKGARAGGLRPLGTKTAFSGLWT